METVNKDTRDEYWANAPDRNEADGYVHTADGSAYEGRLVRVVDSTPVTQPTPREQAYEYFKSSGSVVSPTADAQRWQIPKTESFLPVYEARQISLEVRSALGEVAL